MRSFSAFQNIITSCPCHHGRSRNTERALILFDRIHRPSAAVAKESQAADRIHNLTVRIPLAVILGLGAHSGFRYLGILKVRIWSSTVTPIAKMVNKPGSMSPEKIILTWNVA